MCHLHFGLQRFIRPFIQQLQHWLNKRATVIAKLNKSCKAEIKLYLKLLHGVISKNLEFALFKNV